MTIFLFNNHSYSSKVKEVCSEILLCNRAIKASNNSSAMSA